jgi:DNA-directed RNA polymerase specialized sigma24 family protein
LADEVINRVVRKLPEIIDTYEGPREPYFYGVWKRVMLEIPPPPPPPPPTPTPDELKEKERYDRCLQHCLKQQAPEDRRRLLAYYDAKGREKIELRRRLAAELGISENALRIRLSRLRATLKGCIEACLKQDGE